MWKWDLLKVCLIKFVIIGFKCLNWFGNDRIVECRVIFCLKWNLVIILLCSCFDSRLCLFLNICWWVRLDFGFLLKVVFYICVCFFLFIMLKYWVKLGIRLYFVSNKYIGNFIFKWWVSFCNLVCIEFIFVFSFCLVWCVSLFILMVMIMSLIGLCLWYCFNSIMKLI